MNRPLPSTPIPLVILGAGGHARVLADALLGVGRTVVAFVELPATQVEATMMGIPVRVSDDPLGGFAPGEVELVNGIGSVRPGGRRTDLYAEGLARGFRFATVIHAAAVVSRHCQLGPGVQVLAGAVVQAGSRVGENTLVNTRASIDHDCTVGDSCHISCGAILCGNVTLGAGCHVGPGATIIEGVTLAPATTVAAGAVVVRSQSAPGLLRGVPARMVAQGPSRD